MLTGMRLGNFKAFGPTQQIPIKPITLIFGPNSGGKSSLIHGLLLARHAADTGVLDVHRPDLGGDSVDLGGFRQYVHRHRLDHRVEWGAEVRLDQGPGHRALGVFFKETKRLGITVTFGVDLDDSGLPVPSATPAVTRCEILTDGKPILRMSRRSGGAMRIDNAESTNDVFAGILSFAIRDSGVGDVTDNDFGELHGEFDSLIPRLMYRYEGLFPAGVGAELEGALAEVEESAVAEAQDPRQRLIINAVLAQVPGYLGTLLEELNRAFSSALGRLTYLGPLRSYPPRRLSTLQQHDSNWRAGGGYAWDIVRTNPGVRAKVNAWLGDKERLRTPYELIVQDLLVQTDLDIPVAEALHTIYEPVQERVQGMLDTGDYDADNELVGLALDPEYVAEMIKEAIRFANIERVTELVLKDTRSGTTVSHRDVGIGVSQVLPVLVAAYASQNAIVAIEQPEIHLHPALQTELADVFIQSALGGQGNTFILETHSEHLILRLMRRLRDTVHDTLPAGMPRVQPEDISILFVNADPDAPSSSVRLLRIDEDGEFLDAWPGGFFEEGFRERFS